jgi:3D (Asp-Asp-Asp) domain-containing protein
MCVIAWAALAASAPALADTDPLLEAPEKGYARGTDKTCCGYPLVGEGEWALRFYWMARQSRFGDEYDEQEIYTRDGLYIGAFPERFLRSLRMEGTARLDDGRVLNYHGKCMFGTGTCYQTLNQKRFPFGRGAGRRALVPFRSVAVDRRMVSIGDTLYIPEFDGLPMPDGSIHDGCVRADDTGGSIKKRKMDFFVESRDNWRDILDRLHGLTWITPQVEHPRCRYLLR